MKKNILVGLLLLLMVGCTNEMSNENAKIQKEEASNDVKQAESSHLGEELVLHDLKINDTTEKIIDVLGEPISQEEIREVESSFFNEMVYEQSYFLMKDNAIVGFAVLENMNIKTKAGVAINDSINTLMDAYSDYKVLRMDATYYIYDESFILTFQVEDNFIYQMALFDLDSYLKMSEWTIEDLLLQSEPATKETIQNIDTSPTTSDEMNEGNEDLIDVVEDPIASNTAESQEERNIQEPIVFDTYEKMEQLANFTHSIQIGDDESIIKEFLGTGEENWEDERFTTYGPFPAKFLTQNGKVKLISWGRVELYDNWENDEGVTSYSTYKEVSEAYAEYEHKTLYRQNDEYPSYIIVNYHDTLLVFTFYEGIINTIFQCSPEMLELDMIKNTSFTFDRLEEEPF